MWNPDNFKSETGNKKKGVAGDPGYQQASSLVSACGLSEGIPNASAESRLQAMQKLASDPNTRGMTSETRDTLRGHLASIGK